VLNSFGERGAGRAAAPCEAPATLLVLISADLPLPIS
jgi:hypothetical protein